MGGFWFLLYSRNQSDDLFSVIAELRDSHLVFRTHNFNILLRSLFLTVGFFSRKSCTPLFSVQLFTGKISSSQELKSRPRIAR